MMSRIKGLSLFANVGVAESYLNDVGVDIVIANELLEKRSKFYKHLYPEVDVINGDITNEVVFNDIVRRAKEENVNFIIATPPCQGMSCAGRKDPLDPRNNLITYAVKAIREIRPKYVILENVPRQSKTKIFFDGTYITIPEYVECQLSQEYNFNVHKLINSADYGVPQSRLRYIYLLVKKSENLTWEFPKKEKHIITLSEAIGHLPSLDPDLREVDKRYVFPEFEAKKKQGLEISRWHFPPLSTWKYVEWLMHTPSGKSAFENNVFFPEIDGRRIKGGPQTYKRMHWDKPATTIMSNSNIISAFTTVHPGRAICESDDERLRLYSDARVLSIYELLILSSLPLDWNIPEWASDCLIREVIGEGIPPLLIKKAVAQLNL